MAVTHSLHFWISTNPPVFPRKSRPCNSKVLCDLWSAVLKGCLVWDICCDISPLAGLMQVHPAVQLEPCPASAAASRVNIFADGESLSPAATLLIHTTGLLGMGPEPPVVSKTPSAAPAVEQGRHWSICTFHHCFPLLDFITHLPEGSSDLAYPPCSIVISSPTTYPSETVLPMAASGSSEEEWARKAPQIKPSKAPFSLAQTSYSGNSTFPI